MDPTPDHGTGPWPSITIVTVNLNGGATLERALNSVLGQDYPALEYVVIDGGSTDDSLDILERFRVRLAVLVSEPDAGISDAFNKGIARAHGELIGLISADDQLEPGALRQVAAGYLEAGRPEIIYGNAWYLEAGERFRVRPDPLDCFWRRMPLKHAAVFVARRAYQRLGLFDRDLRFAMDYELLLRFYLGDCRFSYLDRELATIASGGLNQRRLPATIREVRDISRAKGYPAWKANLVCAGKLGKLGLRRLLLAAGLKPLVAWQRRFHRRYRPAPGAKR